jgi:hypothetical protein
VLQNNVKTRTATQYRQAYYAHITRHWKMMQDASGIAALRKIAEMNKIESSYAAARSDDFSVLIPEGLTTLGKIQAVTELADSDDAACASRHAETGDFGRTISVTEVRGYAGCHGTEMYGSVSHANRFIHGYRVSLLSSYISSGYLTRRFAVRKDVLGKIHCN